jgi:biotin operon repressor
MRYERSIAITERHRDILSLVRSGAFSSAHLAEKLGVSEQTVYRDILFLKQQGYAIKSVRRSANWAYQLLSIGSQRQSAGARRR